MHLTEKHTVSTIVTLLQSRIEPDNAEEVLDALRPLDGAMITTRLLDKLPGGRVKWRLSRAMGWTEVRNDAYIRSQGEARDGLRLVLVNTETSAPLSVAFVERENPAYFAGRRERNKLRLQALADEALLSKLAIVMNEVEDMNVRAKLARHSFEVLVEHGTPLSPDRYELERACGLRESHK